MRGKFYGMGQISIVFKSTNRMDRLIDSSFISFTQICVNNM